MSVIVRSDTGEHLLLAKGADNVMLERASAVVPKLEESLTTFAQQVAPFMLRSPIINPH